jgi:hypothetical protein
LSGINSEVEQTQREGMTLAGERARAAARQRYLLGPRELSFFRAFVRVALEPTPSAARLLNDMGQLVSEQAGSVSRGSLQSARPEVNVRPDRERVSIDLGRGRSRTAVDMQMYVSEVAAELRLEERAHRRG